MDLFAAADELERQAGSVDQPLTVAELTYALKNRIETEFAGISVTGEISSLKHAGSGHVYLNLKDQNADAVLSAVIWRSRVGALKVPPQDGQLVTARGRLTLYPPRGQYQMEITQLEPVGAGALLQLLEQLKARLAAEGVFDLERKQELPFLPRRIGIVTSPTGAVIEDMLHRLRDRCPRPVILAPVRVQGEGAAEEIAEAIRAFNRMPEQERPDVLIVARGGGSIEDLWAFNEEPVVRAIATSTIPVISGVGHEPDITLCDLVADYRAPTPTAAMERAVPVRADLLRGMDQVGQRLGSLVAQQLRFKHQKLDLLQARLPRQEHILKPLRVELQMLEDRLDRGVREILRNAGNKLALLERTLPVLSPDAPLERGFVRLATADGETVDSAQTRERDVVLTFKDGKRHAVLDSLS